MRLNYPVIIKVMATLTLIEGIAMLPCVLAAMYFQEWKSANALLVTGIVSISIGFVIITQLKFKKIKLKTHEGFIIACLGWVYCALIGMIPFYFSGCDFSLIGCYFESVAGFTTTGCTVLDQNIMPKALQLWRATCHWLGGMGILILIISIFPLLGIGGRSIASAEAPGSFSDKLRSKASDTGKYLYAIYITFTVAEFLLLLIGPMDWFNALTATLSTISTAGIIINTGNVALFSIPYVRFVILIFTVLSSCSYFFYYLLIRRKWTDARLNIEIKAFLVIIAVATLLISLTLVISGTYSSLWQAVKDSLCQVVSIASTSGYYVCNYMRWPAFTQAILFILMIIGGCSASTAGSLKVFRVIVFIKLVFRGIFRKIHPNSVKPVMVEGNPMPAQVVSTITMHILLYFGVVIVSCLLLSLNNLDMETTISSVIGTFSNTGVALGSIGTTADFSTFNGFSQLILTLLMITGRLEMYAVILMFSRSFWRLDRAAAI